jgi:hypothetical protein
MASVAQYLEKRATNVFPDPVDSATLSFLLSLESEVRASRNCVCRVEP